MSDPADSTARSAPKTAWDESDSRGFLDHGRFFVPERNEQIAAVCALMPDPGSGLMVDLCCGEGLLSRALLERFPRSTVHAYDGSEEMLAHVRRAFAPFGDRFAARPFDLADRSWRRFAGSPQPLHGVVSSLAIHHLDGPGKAALFRDLYAALAPGGALAIADLVQPLGIGAHRFAAASWDQAVERRVAELGAGPQALEVFRSERWNYYADPEPDPIDRPSPLTDQLRWLAEAGFYNVEVVWMKAGHAVFGGVKPAGERPGDEDFGGMQVS